MSFIKKIRIRYILPVVMLGLVSCEEFLDINENPNNPETATSRLLLTSGEVNTGFTVARDLELVAGVLMQYYSGTNNQLSSYDNYDLDGSEWNNPWRFQLYAGAIRDYDEIIRNGTENGEFAYVGIARILRAYTYSLMTDVWGDIPYTEAGQGSAKLAPTFDSQQSIYNDLLAQLDLAIADLAKPSTTTPGADDVIYKGDKAKWLKLANTLKLRAYLQLRKRQPALAATEINKIVAAGNIITTNADDFSLPFGSTTTNAHPMWQFAYSSRPGDIAISQRFIDSMKVNNDPRMPYYFFRQGGSAEYLGYENNSAFAPPTVTTRTRVGRYLVGAPDTIASPALASGAPASTSEQRMLTNYMTKFMLAEAVLTLNTTGDARAYFEQGIRASMAKVGVSAARTDAYVSRRLTEYNAATTDAERLNIVMRDKWIANYGTAIESWNDWRRTGYPQLVPAANATGGNGQIPRSLTYPQQELSSNPNAPDQRQISQRVWWDVE